MSAFSNEVSVNNFPVDAALTDTQLRATPVPVSGPLTDTQLRATPVPVSSTPSTSSSSTVTQITSVIGNQTLLAANANRKKAILSFVSGIWYVKLGATASATSRTIFINNTAYYLEIPTWVGIIDAFCTQTGKVVDVTELV